MNEICILSHLAADGLSQNLFIKLGKPAVIKYFFPLKILHPDERNQLFGTYNLFFNNWANESCGKETKNGNKQSEETLLNSEAQCNCYKSDYNYRFFWLLLFYSCMKGSIYTAIFKAHTQWVLICVSAVAGLVIVDVFCIWRQLENSVVTDLVFNFLMSVFFPVHRVGNSLILIQTLSYRY